MSEPTKAAPILILIDASNFIFRAYHAIQHLSTSRGVATNAVYGFTRMMLKTLRELDPQFVALAFDKESRTGRLAIDPTYKANREGPPADLIPQFDLIRRVVSALNLPVVEARGWEADDVIGTLTLRARQQGFHVLVVTGDKDFVQIVGDGVELYDPMNDKRTTPVEVQERYSIDPSQMRDYLALVGDAIDNVAKVPGIGPKTAVDLLKQFHDVETLLERLDEVPKPKIREAIRAHRETLLRAKQLVTFKTDLPLEETIESFARRPIHDSQARDLFSELEFFKLLQEMPAPVPTPLPERTSIIDTREQLESLVVEVRAAGAISLIPAYDGLPYAAELVGLGVALPGNRTYYVPVAHRMLGSQPQFSHTELRAALAPMLEDPQVRKTGHGLKSLIHLLRRLGIAMQGEEGDVELLSYLLNPSRREHALSDLARERLRLELPAMPASAQGKKGPPVAELTVEEVASCYGACAEGARRLAEELWPEIDRAGLRKLALEIELPLMPILAEMEASGVKLDLGAIANLNQRVEAQSAVQLAEIYRLAGHEFNVHSNAQLTQVLYTELKLPVLKRGRTGPSTDSEVLEKLAEQHELPKVITEYRMLSKLKSTYLDTLPTLVAKDGRLHTSYNQAGAATGRLSSSDPNLQNIPIRTELGRDIRRAFIAEEGNVLISADYSQIELRLLAHVAEDPVLIEAFANDEDVHTRTASEVFAVPPAEVTPQQRGTAKMVNYAIAYGLSPHGLSTRLDIPNEEARAIIERYFARYAGIKRYLEQTVEKAQRSGYVETLFGRRRFIPDLHSRNRGAAQAAERAAINMPIQGTAADLIKMAMIKVAAALREAKSPARMLLQVHDELLFEAPESEAHAIAELARRHMSEAASLKVPLRVDVGIGKTWSDAH